MLDIGAHVLRNGLNEIKGTVFNIWAPGVECDHAVKVLIEHEGKEKEFCLKKNVEDEYWSVFVHANQGGIPGNKYRYKIYRDREYYIFADLASRSVEYSLESNSLAIDVATCKSSIVDYNHHWKKPNFSIKQENLIIYQLHFGSFVKRSLPVSLIKQAEQLLSYIKNLNFSAIQLLPTQAFSNKKPSAGYDPAYYFAPSPQYGSPQDLREFVDKAHELGLAVIFDVVFNHFPFFGNCFWGYQFTSAESQAGYFVSSESVIRADEIETPWGRKPNFSQQEVRNFFIQNLYMYINEYHADGFRFDCPNEIINWGNKSGKSDGEDFLKEVAEMLKYFENKQIHIISEQVISEECLGFHAAWYKEGQIHFANTYREAAKSLAPLRSKDSLVEIISLINKHQYVNYLLGSHDECVKSENKGNNIDGYFAELFCDDMKKEQSMLGWCLNVTLPGIPMIFMGTELLQSGYWGPGFQINWELHKEEASQQMIKLVTDMNFCRLNQPALTAGKCSILYRKSDEPVLAYLRYTTKELVIIVVNFSNHTYPLYDITYDAKEEQPTEIGEPIERRQELLKPGQRWCNFFCSQYKKYGGTYEGFNPEPRVAIKANGAKINLQPLPQRSVTLLKPM